MAAKKKRASYVKKTASATEVAELREQVRQQAEQNGKLIAMFEDMSTSLSDKRDVQAGAGGMTPGQIVDLVRRASDTMRRPDYEPLTGKAREELDAVDPLAWITEETPAAFFVGSQGSWPLRHEWQGTSGVKIEKFRCRPIEMVKPWYSCPFVFADPHGNIDNFRNNTLNSSQWWHHVISRQDAVASWIGRDPFPREVVVTMKDIVGRQGRQLVGKERLSSGIALREIVRKSLQMHPKRLFLDTDRYCNGVAVKLPGDYVGTPHSHVDAWEPNPYSVGCECALGEDTISPFREGMIVNRGATHDVAVAERITPEMAKVVQ